jgi:hypothetical protein
MKERVGNRGRGLRGQCAPGWRQASSRFSILAELILIIFVQLDYAFAVGVLPASSYLSLESEKRR